MGQIHKHQDIEIIVHTISTIEFNKNLKYSGRVEHFDNLLFFILIHIFFVSKNFYLTATAQSLNLRLQKHPAPPFYVNH